MEATAHRCAPSPAAVPGGTETIARDRPSSADAFAPLVRLQIIVTLDRIEARWRHVIADYVIGGGRGALERGDMSGLERSRRLVDPYLGQLPQAFEAHLLPT